MMSGALVPIGVALVAVAAAQVAPVSVGELLSNPDRFRDQPVTVSGTMSDLRENVTRQRTHYYTFDLSDGTQTVHVVSYQKPQCRGGRDGRGLLRTGEMASEGELLLRENNGSERDLLPRRRTEDEVIPSGLGNQRAPT
jgi:hypothetical protein